MANKKFETLDGFNSQGDVTIAGNVAVDTDVFFVDTVNNRVGIGKTNPTTLFDVDGNITATNVNATFYGDGSNLTGLQADSIDGISANSFLRADANTTFTGDSIEFEIANVAVTGSGSELLIFQDIPLRFGNTSTPSVSFTFSRTGPTAGDLDITTNGTVGITVTNDFTVNGAITANNVNTANLNVDYINFSTIDAPLVSTAQIELTLANGLLFNVDSSNVFRVVSTGIFPEANSTIDLGSTIKRWDQLYVDDVIVTANVSAVNLSGNGASVTSVNAAAVGGNTASTLLSRANHTGTQLLSTISDAGTIASQDADSVNIDGGAIDGTPIGASTANTGKFSALTITGEIVEGIHTLTGTTPVLDPANGTVQTWTLSGASTPTDGLANGESMVLLIDDNSDYTITWPSTTWIGGSAPTLDTTNETVVELWKVGGTLYGALVGVAS